MLFDIGKRVGLGEARSGFDSDTGNLRIGDVYAGHGGGSYGGAFLAGVINHELVSGLHLAKMFYGDGICDTVPDGFAVALEIGEGVSVRLGFEQVMQVRLFVAAATAAARVPAASAAGRKSAAAMSSACRETAAAGARSADTAARPVTRVAGE